MKSFVHASRTCHHSDGVTSGLPSSHHRDPILSSFLIPFLIPHFFLFYFLFFVTDPHSQVSILTTLSLSLHNTTLSLSLHNINPCKFVSTRLSTCAKAQFREYMIVRRSGYMNCPSH